MTGRVPYSPGTINPALLTRPSPQPGTGALEASPFTDESTALVAARKNASTTKPSSPGARRPPRLPRISSECDLEDEILAFLLASSNDLTQTRREFDGLTGIHNPRADKRITAHRRYFKSQTEAAGELHILADPEAFGDAEIVVDAANYSIYDAYLLSADVTRNVNLFQRHRVGPPAPRGRGGTVLTTFYRSSSICSQGNMCSPPGRAALASRASTTP